jgi:glycerol-3-phosphate O-acyltransferase/dihydroxyacetone phosphate acyltransferase
MKKIVYSIIRLLFTLITNIFFRDMEVVGLEHIPMDGPVIFVGNHQNQFVDGGILVVHIPRPIRFIIAEKSLRRRIVGPLARLLESIPVRRPQDYAKAGQGTVSSRGSEIEGKGTKFTAQLKHGELLLVNGITKEGEEIPKVTQIIDDTHIKVSPPFEESFTDMNYKIIPKLDQSQVYEAVWDALEEGTCIGLFPEGGSHDRTGLLPLKAGVALMALGAMSRKPGLKVRIVPCGLNYFQGHRFRSFVVVEFGKPIEVDSDLVEKYRTDKRTACSQLLNTVERSLYSVTLNAPDLATLQAIQLGRRLYQPLGVEITPEQYLELTRRFAEGYIRFKDQPAIRHLMETTMRYKTMLDHYGLRDYQVAVGGAIPASLLDRASLLFGRVIVMTLLLVLALPGAVLHMPIVIPAKLLAIRHARQAKRASTVKIEGRDVIASYKILVSMVLLPLLYICYSSVVGHYYGAMWGALTLLVILPVVGYASMRLVEIGWELWRSTFPLFLSLLPGGNTYHQELKKMREELKKEIRKVVETYGPQMKEFWDNRIIPDEVIARDTEVGSLSLRRPPSYVKKPHVQTPQSDDATS